MKHAKLLRARSASTMMLASFTSPSPTRHDKLVPFKDGVLKLRQKDALPRLIREWLAKADVAVATDTSRVCCGNKRRFNPTAAGKMNRRWAASCPETGLPSTRRRLSVTSSDTAAISTRRSSSRRDTIRRANRAFRRPRTSHCRSPQPLVTRHVHGRTNQSRHQPQRRREELLRYELRPARDPWPPKEL